ncbi:MAG: hypothetical protein WBP26_04330 [Candidatus Saccharimonadales bacterium]
MSKQTDTRRVLFAHTLRRLLLGLFVFLSLGGSVFGVFVQGTSVNAATNDRINFQARLLSGAGNVVSDGNYNVEFKIYNAQSSSGSSQGSCSGDAACLWVETRTGGNRARVANGYMSVALGSVTAFPVEMDWSQDLWLTMNIGGANVSASWDGEMNPRLHLTAVPYAMSAAHAVRAGTADILQNTGANASTLGWAAQTSTQSILLPDASGTLCLAGSEGCGFAINGGNTTGAAFTIGTNDNYGLNLEVNNTTVASFTNTGAAVFKNTTNSTNAFAVQTAAGQSVLHVDTTNSRVGIGTANPGATLSVVGNFSIQDAETPTKGYRFRTTGSALDVEAAGQNLYLSVWSGAGYTGTQHNQMIFHPNGASIDMLKGLVITAGASHEGLVVNGGPATTEDLLQLNTDGAGFSQLQVDATGAATWRNSTNSASAFDVQNAGGNSLFKVDTTNSNVVVGGTLTIDGATVNNTLALGNFSSGGSIGSAATTVDIYTAISINQTTASQTLTIPTPTASTAYGRTLLISNIGSANFTLLGSLLKTGSSAWLVWSNTTGGATWQYAGADGSSILNQNSTTQTANFSINGTGTASTLTAGSFTSTSNLILQAASGNDITVSPGAAGNGSGTLNLAVNAAALNIGNGSNNVRTIAIGNTSGSQAQTVTIGNSAGTASTTTIQGSGGILLSTNSSSAGVVARSTTNSTTAFVIQNTSSQSLFLVDTTNSLITIGSGVTTTFRVGDAVNNTSYDSSTGASTLNGNARRARKIMLQPEYVGAVLDATNDAACSSANSGTLTAGLDLSNRKNYYNWTSASGSAQCYNVVVQVPVPSDFSAWASTTPLKVNAHTSHTSNGTANIELRDTTGNVIYNYVSVTPGSTNTWTETTIGTSISGTYTPGDYMTLRLRVSSLNNANLRIGTVTLDYLSKW